MNVLTSDGIALHVEEAGSGPAVVFLHEFAGDHRSWEPQVRFLSRGHRCVVFAARGYTPSDVPEDPAAYSQDRACDDVVAVLDALNIDRAHIIGHSMGAYTALHVGLRFASRCLSVAVLGCGWGSNPVERDASIRACEDIAAMFAAEPMDVVAASYARAPMRRTFEAKDPRGFAEFERMLAGHLGIGSALTMLNLQLKRPTLWEMEDRLRAFAVPLLVVVGDEDFPCIEGSLFLKRTVPTAGLLVLPRAGHTITSEEPAAVNAALAELFAAVGAGTWMSHRPPVGGRKAGTRMTTGGVAIERLDAGALVLVTLSSPARRNALSAAMWQAIATLAADIVSDTTIRALVFRGDGGHFSAGADITGFAEGRSGAVADTAYDDLVEATCRAVERMACPTIALIEGFCLGAGASLAASCDLRIAADDACFAVPAARLGLGYDIRGIARFNRVFGIAATSQLLLTADRMTADRAHALGAVQVVAPAGTVETVALATARRVCANAPLTLRAAKLAQRALAGTDPILHEQARAAARLADDSVDYREGRAAFAEKRDPRFRGR